MLNLSNLFALDKIVDISKKTGISTGNICDWKSGRSKPSAETLINIAECYNCSVDYLLGRTNMKHFVKEPTNIIQIPILPQSAAAGFGKSTNDFSSDKPEMKWFYQDQVPYGTKYGITIEGDSMMPKFHDGQTVFIKLADDCNDGDYGIFCITENDNTKVYFKQKQMVNSSTYKLHSLNTKKYKDITDFENKICRCVAIVIG